MIHVLIGLDEELRCSLFRIHMTNHPLKMHKRQHLLADARSVDRDQELKILPVISGNIIRVYYELSKNISAHLINTFLSGVMLAGRSFCTRTHLKSSKFHGMRESTFRRGT